jgi:hypothetical protein
MDTSRTIKSGQYRPIAGTHDGNRWTFASRSRERVTYTVERDGNAYRCGCPATGLCRHITAAVLDDAKVKWSVVQVWTSWSDAARQHRKAVELTANGRPFWVTYAGQRRADEVATLDAEINDLGIQLERARRRWYSVGGGQVKADARMEIERLRGLLMEKQTERARVAGQQMREAA